MVQNSQTTTWDGAKNLENTGIETTNLSTSTGEFTRFLKHHQ